MIENKVSRLWNANFILLWQGSLVSFIGDMLYQFALGFWVLEKTGSTAVMAIVIAAGYFPQIIIGIFAGTYVDRHDRKKIIVMADYTWNCCPGRWYSGIFKSFACLGSSDSLSDNRYMQQLLLPGYWIQYPGYCPNKIFR